MMERGEGGQTRQAAQMQKDLLPAPQCRETFEMVAPRLGGKTWETHSGTEMVIHRRYCREEHATQRAKQRRDGHGFQVIACTQRLEA